VSAPDLDQPTRGRRGPNPTIRATGQNLCFVVWGGPVFTVTDRSSTLDGYAQDGAAWDPGSDTWQPIDDLPPGFVPMSGVVAGDRFLTLFQVTNDPATNDDDDVGILELHP